MEHEQKEDKCFLDLSDLINHLFNQSLENKAALPLQVLFSYRSRFIALQIASFPPHGKSHKVCWLFGFCICILCLIPDSCTTNWTNCPAVSLPFCLARKSALIFLNDSSAISHSTHQNLFSKANSSSEFPFSTANHQIFSNSFPADISLIK